MNNNWLSKEPLYTLEEAGDILGVRPSTINNWINGRSLRKGNICGTVTKESVNTLAEFKDGEISEEEVNKRGLVVPTKIASMRRKKDNDENMVPRIENLLKCDAPFVNAGDIAWALGTQTMNVVSMIEDKMIYSFMALYRHEYIVPKKAFECLIYDLPYSEEEGRIEQKAYLRSIIDDRMSRIDSLTDEVDAIWRKYNSI